MVLAAQIDRKFDWNNRTYMSEKCPNRTKILKQVCQQDTKPPYRRFTSRGGGGTAS